MRASAIRASRHFRTSRWLFDIDCSFNRRLKHSKGQEGLARLGSLGLAFASFSPGAPLGPAGPISPWIPISPFTPLSPVGPIGPCLPEGPSEPGLPGGPVSLAFPVFLASLNFLFVLIGRGFHLWRKFGFAAFEALAWSAIWYQRSFGQIQELITLVIGSWQISVVTAQEKSSEQVLTSKPQKGWNWHLEETLIAIYDTSGVEKRN